MSAARILQPDREIVLPSTAEILAISRRPGASHNRGRVAARGPSAAAPAGTTPPTIVTSAPCQAWWRGDLGITIGTGVSAWADQSGNGRDLVQATGGAQPVYNASDFVFGAQSTLTFDGVNDILIGAFGLPAAGTTPAFIWYVMSQQSWVNGRNLSAGATPASHHLFQNTPSPNVSQYNGVITNNTLWALNSVARIENYFSNSAADYLKIVGTTTNSGVSAGNTAPCSQFCLGGTGASFGAVTIAECAIWYALPTPAERAALDAYVFSRYGTGV
jgi:hypothetical protein